MPIIPPPFSDSDLKIAGGAIVLLGASMLGAGAVFGERAFAHVAFAAALCGPSQGHCLSCGLALVSLAGAGAAFALGGHLLFQRAEVHAVSGRVWAIAALTE